VLLDVVFLGLLVIAGWEWLNSGGASSAESTDTATDTGGNVTNFAQAIFRFESGGDYSNSKAARNNNPGNLRAPNGNPAYWQGQTGTDPNGGYAIFDSLSSGFRALQMQININARRSPNMTLTQFFAKWLGQNPANPEITSEGNPFTYAATVAGWLGLNKENTITEAAAA
jgi:hypothetical protein